MRDVNAADVFSRHTICKQCLGHGWTAIDEQLELTF